MRQFSLFTRGGKPYSEEAERAELRVMILDHLAEVFHVWEGAEGKPIPLRGDCPNCGMAQMALLVNPLSLFAIAYCRECGWAKDFDLTK